MSVELSIPEADAICERMLRNVGVDFSSANPALKAQSLAAVLTLVQTMQEMGYRITRPLREVQ